MKLFEGTRKREKRKGEYVMKKMISLVLALALACVMGVSALAAGTVSTDGSTSMEKVIGALG